MADASSGPRLRLTAGKLFRNRIDERPRVRLGMNVAREFVQVNGGLASLLPFFTRLFRALLMSRLGVRVWLLPSSEEEHAGERDRFHRFLPKARIPVTNG